MADPRDLLNIERCGKAMERHARIHAPFGDLDLVTLETSISYVNDVKGGEKRVMFLGGHGRIASMRLPAALQPRRHASIVIQSIEQNGHCVAVRAALPDSGRSVLLPGFSRHVLPRRSKAAYAGLFGIAAAAAGLAGTAMLPALSALAIGVAALLAIGSLEFIRHRKLAFLRRILD